jgi:hypothetical protein
MVYRFEVPIPEWRATESVSSARTLWKLRRHAAVRTGARERAAAQTGGKAATAI